MDQRSSELLLLGFPTMHRREPDHAELGTRGRAALVPERRGRPQGRSSLQHGLGALPILICHGLKKPLAEAWPHPELQACHACCDGDASMREAVKLLACRSCIAISCTASLVSSTTLSKSMPLPLFLSRIHALFSSVSRCPRCGSSRIDQLPPGKPTSLALGVIGLHLVSCHHCLLRLYSWRAKPRPGKFIGI